MQKWKYLVASICNTIVYGIVVFNNEFISILSNSAGTIDAVGLSTRFSAFRYLSCITTGFSIIGWFALIMAFEELTKFQMDMAHHDDVTGDESQEEDV